jgi:regulator of protease activity HflC (stomatin/prohibitin superfamily)
MNPKFASVAIVALIVLVFGGRFVKTVPPGHVGVATLFGEVNDMPFDEGLHFPVNPLYQWVDFDLRQKTLKETAQIPTRDQLQTRVDVSVQYRFVGAMAPSVLQDTGDARSAVEVHLIPTLRSQVREQGSSIARAEDFFNAETRSNLESGLLATLQDKLTSKGIEVQAVLIRDINLPEVLARAIEQKKEREQAVERQKAELERFRTEQLEQVAKAQAERKAAEENAKRIEIMADAKAYEIRKINDAVASNPSYIQLQSLEALKAMSKDPAAKLYFMDSNSTSPLPLLHMGDVAK